MPLSSILSIFRRRMEYTPLPITTPPPTPPRFSQAGFKEDPIVKEMFAHTEGLRRDIEGEKWKRVRRRRVVGVQLCLGFLGMVVLSYTVIVWFLPDAPAGGFRWKGKGKMEDWVEEIEVDVGLDGLEEEGVSNVTVTKPDGIIPIDYTSSTKDPYSTLLGVYPLIFDPSHVLVPIIPLPPSRPLLSPFTRLDQSILTSYYTTGLLPTSVVPLAPEPIDIVYLWVNASSHYLDVAMEAKAELEHVNIHRGKAKHWRDNGELRGAIRSSKAAFGSDVSKVHVITADLDFEWDEERWMLPSQDKAVEGLQVEGWKVGQVPEWLDWEKMNEEGEVRWHFHSEVFRLPRDEEGTLGVEGYDEVEWRREALPSFDSFGIESRLPWVQGLKEHLYVKDTRQET
jgi:hypothetical protein